MSGQDDKINWLHSEVQRWLREGIVDASQARSISGLYPLPQTKTSRPWALMVFSGIGAVIVGLGVILLFAYNWDQMSKFAKLSVVFGSLILAHLIGIMLFVRSERFRGIGESLCLLGTMLFGAGIWLIAQIYHIEEHYPNAFLLWGIGAFLMAWTMPSIIQAILASVLFAIWAGAESMEFSSSVPYVFAFLLLMLPIAYAKRSRTLLIVLLISFVFSTIFVVASYKEGMLVFPVLLGIFSVCTVAGLIHQKFKYELFASCYSFLGLAGYFIVMYLLAFPCILEEVVKIRNFFDVGILFYWFVPSVIAVAGWIYIAGQVLKKNTFEFYSPDLFLMPLMAIFLYYYYFSITKYFQWPASAVFNLVFLAHSVMLMGRGCLNVRLIPVIIGSLFIIALMIARFTDFIDNLAVRGLIFVVIGILIFGQGFFYIHSKKKKALRES